MSRYSRRVAKIRKARHEGVTGYRLPDGSVKYIRSKSVYDAYREACEGVDTPRARVILAAVDCVTPESGGRLHEFAQALQGPAHAENIPVPGGQPRQGYGPTVQHQPTPTKETIQ